MWNQNDKDAIATSIQNGPIGRHVAIYSAVDSTMSLTHEAAQRKPLPTGLVIVAEEQIKGRGRYDRRWKAPEGSALLVSILLGPQQIPQRMEQLPMLVGVGAARGITSLSPELANRVKLKWPNDLILRTPLTNEGEDNLLSKSYPTKVGKVGGILIETVFNSTGSQNADSQSTAVAHAVVGIGINVNMDEEQLNTIPVGSVQPTSLQVTLGRKVDRVRLLINICVELNYLLPPSTESQPGNQQFMPRIENVEQSTYETMLFSLWKQQLQTLGQDVIVTDRFSPDAHSTDSTTSKNGSPSNSSLGQFKGKAVDVTPSGSLIVENQYGQRRVFAYGDVSLQEKVHF